MIVHSSRFPKSSRLHLRKEIETLFTTGKKLVEFPLKAIYDFTPLSVSPVQIAVVVPKKNFKRAVDRNRIKRQLREAFRKHNTGTRDFFHDKNVTVKVLFIFMGKELPDYGILEAKIILILQRLRKQYELGIV